MDMEIDLIYRIAIIDNDSTYRFPLDRIKLDQNNISTIPIKLREGILYFKTPTGKIIPATEEEGVISLPIGTEVFWNETKSGINLSKGWKYFEILEHRAIGYNIVSIHLDTKQIISRNRKILKLI